MKVSTLFLNPAESTLEHVTEALARIDDVVAVGERVADCHVRPSRAIGPGHFLLIVDDEAVTWDGEKLTEHAIARKAGDS